MAAFQQIEDAFGKFGIDAQRFLLWQGEKTSDDIAHLVTVHQPDIVGPIGPPTGFVIKDRLSGQTTSQFGAIQLPGEQALQLKAHPLADQSSAFHAIEKFRCMAGAGLGAAHLAVPGPRLAG